MRKVICIMLMLSVFFLSSCAEYFKETDNMKQFKEDITGIDHIVEMYYVFGGHPHSSWGTMGMMIIVDDEIETINDDLLIDIYELIFSFDNVVKDMYDQGAVEYYITFRHCDSEDNIFGLADIGIDLKNWSMSDNRVLEVRDDGIIIVNYDEYLAEKGS